MTRDQLLAELVAARQAFDEKVALVPRDALRDEVPGYGYSVVQLLAHVAEYDRLVVNRLESAGHGAATQLQADHGNRDSFERYTWTFADRWSVEHVMRRSRTNFESVVSHVRALGDEELEGRAGAGGALDRAWLAGRPPWQAVYDDTAGHYLRHFEMLDVACTMLVMA